MEVILITQPVTPTLNDSNLVVEPFDESQGHFVLGLTVRGDPRPVPLDQLRELLERFQSLPSQRGAPLVEELARPRLPAICPELTKLLLQHVRGVESLVGRQQCLELPPLVR